MSAQEDDAPSNVPRRHLVHPPQWFCYGGRVGRAETLAAGKMPAAR